MPPSDRPRLPAGLPRLISGTEGFDALCKLLPIVSTKQKQAIAGAPAVRQVVKAVRQPAPRPRQAERLRQELLSFYGDPDARRRVWIDHFERGFLNDDPEHPLIPSLERAALAAYDQELLESAPPPEDLEDCSALYSPDAGDDAWRGPALAALPRLRSDFAEWQTLPSGRRRDVILAAFATATLLDDTRLLEWAGTLSEEIAQAYPFWPAHGAAPDSESGDGANPTARDDTEEDTLGELRAAAMQLAVAANALAEQPPSDTLFDSVAELAGDVLRLRDPTLDEVALETTANLLADFADIVSEEAQVAPWLAAHIDKVMDAWRSAYPDERGTRADELDADLRRAKAQLDELLPKWSGAQTAADQAREALERHESGMKPGSVGDLQVQATRSAEVSATLQAALGAMERVLAALEPSPAGGPFGSPTVTERRGTPVAATRTTPAADSADTDDMPTAATPAQDRTGEEQLDTTASSEADTDEPPQPETTTSDGAGGPQESGPSEERKRRGRREGVPHDEPDSEPAVVAANFVEQAVWKAIGGGRMALAYQISLLNQTMEGRAAVPSPDLLVAVALGTALRSPDDALSLAFGQQISAVLDGLDASDTVGAARDALHLLVFSAGLRPALFVDQQGGGAALLRHVEPSRELTPVYRLANAIADHAERERGVHLDVDTLKAVLNESVWKDRIARHAEEVGRWRSSAAAATFLSGAAGRVWQRWLSNRGILAELAGLLSSADRRHVTRVSEIVALLGDRKSVHGLIERTYRQGLGGRGGSIHGRALSQFEGRLSAPVDLATTWLRIMEARPGGTGYVERVVERLERDVESYAPAARDAIERLERTQPGMALTNALKCARNAIEAVHRIFRRQPDDDPGLVVAPVEVLSDDLLFVPGLRIDDQGNLDASIRPAEALARMLDTPSHAGTLSEAFELRLAQGDLYGAYAVCGRMAAEDDPEEDVYRDRLMQALAQARPEMQRRLHDLTDKLEQAFIIGEVSEGERADLNASIAEATRRLGPAGESLTVANDVAAIERQVEPCFAQGVAQVKAQLDAYLPLMIPGSRHSSRMRSTRGT